MAAKAKTAPKPAAKPAAAKKPDPAEKRQAGARGLKIHPDDARKAVTLLADFVTERAEVAKDKARCGNTVGAVKLMDALLRFKEDLQDRVKSPLEEAYNHMRFTTVPTMMEEEGIDKITVEDVGRVNVTDDVQVQVLNKDGLFDWLVENEFEDMITKVVNAATLAAFVRRRMKEAASLPQDTVLKVTPVVRAAITRS